MAEAWAGLPDQRADRAISPRGAVGLSLQFAIRRGLRDNVLRYLIAKARDSEALTHQLAWLLESVDHPMVVEFLVRHATRIKAQLAGTGRFSPWLLNLGDQWDPLDHKRPPRLSVESRQVMERLWRDPTEPDALRTTALSLWARATDDIVALRDTPEEYLSVALQRRAQLGDQQVVSHVSRRASEQPFWFTTMAPIWCPELRDVTDAALANIATNMPNDRSIRSANSSHFLAHLIRDIPAVDAEELLLKHWEGLALSPLFIQAALYVGTARTAAAAAKAIAAWPQPAPEGPLEHIEMFYGFMAFGLQDRIERRHLESLQPYLPLLDDRALEDMAVYSFRHGAQDWAHEHLACEVNRRRRRSSAGAAQPSATINRVGAMWFPTDHDLVEGLESLLKPHPFVRLWAEQFDQRHDPPRRWRHAIQTWCGHSLSLEKLRVATELVSILGDRSDVQWLHTLLSLVDAAHRHDAQRLIVDTAFSVSRRTLA